MKLTADTGWSNFRRDMYRFVERGSRAVIWFFAFVMALAAARYFYLSPQLVDDLEDQANAAVSQAIHAPPIPSIHPFAHHPVLLSIHVVGGMVAILVGLFQFLPRLRDLRPVLHRRLGYTYIAAVAIGAVSGFPLSFLFFDPLPAEMRRSLMPVTLGFAILSIAWLFTTGMALYHARQLHFETHRAWMLRSYCLTYAAVTTRLVAPVFLLLTRDPITTTNLALCSWPLNLLFAEWLIRRQPGQLSPVKMRSVAASGD